MSTQSKDLCICLHFHNLQTLNPATINHLHHFCHPERSRSARDGAVEGSMHLPSPPPHSNSQSRDHLPPSPFCHPARRTNQAQRGECAVLVILSAAGAHATAQSKDLCICSCHPERSRRIYALAFTSTTFKLSIPRPSITFTIFVILSAAGANATAKSKDLCICSCHPERSRRIYAFTSTIFKLSSPRSSITFTVFVIPSAVEGSMPSLPQSSNSQSHGHRSLSPPRA